MDFDELGVSIFEQDKLIEVSSSTEFEDKKVGMCFSLFKVSVHISTTCISYDFQMTSSPKTGQTIFWKSLQRKITALFTKCLVIFF